MKSTAPQLTQAPNRPAGPRPTAARPASQILERRSPRRGSAAPGRQTCGQLLYATAPLFEAPAFYGPPVTFVLGPWLLLVLLLIGPFALILTLVLALAVAAGLLAVVVALIASPYLLIRHLHSAGGVYAKPPRALHLFHQHRAGAGRLDSLQPKGVS
jgi:hypothetical protein